jgi:hypothetical protein
MMGRIKVVAGSAFALLLLGPFGVALADDPCPLTDLNCIVGAADQTVNDATGTADDTTKTVVHEVRTTVDHIRSTVRDLLDPGGDEPGGGDDHGGDGHGGRGNGGARDDGSGTGGLRHPTRGSVAPPAGNAVPAPATVPTVVTMSDRLADDASAGVGIPGFLREAAIGIALPLILVMLLLLVFTAIQDRLDRRDPKLALAPLATDVLRFE